MLECRRSACGGLGSVQWDLSTLFISIGTMKISAKLRTGYIFSAAIVIQKNIFDHFVQASTAEESIKGVGLGLTICRQYASLMGGRISVRSQPGKGSTFIVELPLESVDESLILPEATKRRVVGLELDQPMFNILIVEDDDYSRIVLRQLLEQVDFGVLEAKDGRQAVEMCKLNQPDLVWMDIRLPVMDGLEATKKIRNLESKMQNRQASHYRADRKRV